MKVLYLANGLPHYFNLVLNKLNGTPGVELAVVAPSGRGQYIDAAVHQTREGVNFRIIELEEYTRGPFYASFRGLSAVLVRERPNVVVLPEHLLRGFQLHPGLWLLRKLLRIRLILKSIPFRLSDYQSERQTITEMGKNVEGRMVLQQLLGLLQIPRMTRWMAIELRRHRFCLVDAHVNYVDSAREILGSYGVPQGKIFITRNSPDTDALRVTEQTVLHPSARPQRSPYRLLHIGRLVPQKRVDLLIEALVEVRKVVAQAELVVVGGGPERDRLETMGQSLGLADGVRFVGPVYDPVELARHFLSASIFVLPGLGGLSINEAMFYGLAVVCATGDGTERYLVREGWNGAYFTENSVSSLTTVLVRLLSDQQELVKMSPRSRAIIDNEVNINTVIDEYLKAFRYVCA